MSGDLDISSHLFDFQRHCVEFALRLGRCGLFLDTGLGKTLCQLEFCRHAAEETNGKALILTPLAVARQICNEGVKFGYDCRVIREQSEAREGINICNYDRLEKIDADSFGSVSLDESSILKSFTGKTCQALIATFDQHRFRMAATATPAPNDHMELGNHAEFLGVMSSTEMLMRFFINDTSTASQQWRLKGHAVRDFWDWMASWSRMAQTPEDLGFDGSRFDLPPLNVHRHRIGGSIKPKDGALFAGSVSATDMFDIKRQTAATRADAASDLANDIIVPWVIWCDTDIESAAIKARIPDAVEVRGSHHADMKEECLAAFASGDARVIITKPSIAGFGLNWQHCSNVIFAGRTFSYENYYQAVRRCWRFGQKNTVNVHLLLAAGEDQIGRVIDAKASSHSSMKAAMAQSMRRNSGSETSRKIPYIPTHKGSVPAWL